MAATPDRVLPGAGHRVVTGVRAHTAAFFRNPLYLVLLLALPPVEVWLAGEALGSLPAVAFPAVPTSMATTGRLFGAAYATAVFAGVVGLFQRLSADETDRRLVVAGSSPGRLFLTRTCTVLGITLVVAGVATAALVGAADVADPGLAFAVLALGGGLYAFVGLLVGSVVSTELEGSVLLVFLVDVDVVLATGVLPTDLLAGKLFPLYHPYQLLEAAVVDGGVPANGSHLLFSGAYVLLVAGVAVALYLRTVSVPGGRGR